VVTAIKPKVQTRKTREEAKVVRSMNYPVPNFCLDHRFVRPNYAQRWAVFPCSETRLGAPNSPRRPTSLLFLLRRCSQTDFGCLPGTGTSAEIRLGGWGFQKIKEGLQKNPAYETKAGFVRCTNFLIFLCGALYMLRRPGSSAGRYQFGKGNLHHGQG
jgi:hypothetical protein